jgi:hypothetical protein
MASTVLGLWVVVTCKGRLEFLKLTAPGLLEQGVNFCLVDYDCPEGSGDWLLAFAAEHQYRGDVKVARHLPAPRFHKPHAQNLGAREAMRHGATHLMFLDADTVHAPGSIEATIGLLAEPGFVIAGRDAEDRSIRSLTGLIALSVEDYVKAGGYDEAFTGWGGEDLELRLRLHLQFGLAFRELPHRYVTAIPHSDLLRTEFYENQDLEDSSLESLRTLQQKVLQWTGLRLGELVPPASRLLYTQPPRDWGASASSPKK